MNKNLLKSLNAAAIILLMAATFISCSNGTMEEQLNNEIDSKSLNDDFEIMKIELKEIGNILNEEQSFFVESEGLMDYESFVSEQPKNIEDIEENYSAAHSRVLDELDELKASYTDENSLKRISELDIYQKQLTDLLTDSLEYHYMMLENDLILSAFDNKIVELMDLMSEGEVTTIEYNANLELLMGKYESLLNVNSLSVADEAYLGTTEEIEDLLANVADAKRDIENIEVYSKIDVATNQIVYEMFDYVEKSLMVAYNYLNLTMEPAYDAIGKIHEDPSKYIENTLNKMVNPLTID